MPHTSSSICSIHPLGLKENEVGSTVVLWTESRGIKEL